MLISRATEESSSEAIVNVPSKTLVRLAFFGVIALSAVSLGTSYAASGLGGTTEELAADRYESGSEGPVAPPANGVTVISTDSNAWLGEQSDDPRSKAEMMAFASNGSVLYYNDSHTRYWDVDPVPGTRRTIEYAYADHLNGSACPEFLSASYYENSAYANSVNRSVWETYAEAQEPVGACTRNGIVRANMTTGESTTIYSAITPGKHSTRWHDADRINDTHVAVADIFLDRAFVVDTRSGNITWQWRATEAFSPNRSGGPYPGDWTHANDIEVLPDGRLALDLRNNDRVVFLDPTESPEEAFQANWTLGAENVHSILYEQHNPDYIPPAEGGPALVIGDSENNRAIEYRRVNGSWERTWSWQDARMQWTRDADRLANGHTLLTDSNGDRVLEVDERGEVVWSVEVGFPYEAERLGTGDESESGPSARSAAIASNQPDTLETAWLRVKGVLAGPEFQALYYVSPRWMRSTDIAAALVTGIGALGWILTEGWWALSMRARLSQVFAR
jgi:hypothetical protein